MKKINIITFLFLLVFSSLKVSAEVFTLGSCNHKIASGNGYGSDSSGEIAAAMYVPASRLVTLAGNRISRIDVGLISRINVREMTVWVRKSLDGQNLASGFIERGSLGWNEVTLNNPYEIEKDCPGLYIGFNYANTGSSHPVSFTGAAGDFTSYLRTSANGKWEDMSSKGSLSLEAIVTGDNLPLYDLALLSGSVFPNPNAGENAYTVSGKVYNMAMRPVSGFELTVSKGNDKVGTLSIPLTVAPGESSKFSGDFISESDLKGDVMLTLESLFDGADADNSNNNFTASISFPRNVLLEEFTTERCSNCPDAAEAIHKILNSDFQYAPNVVMVCHHAGYGTDWLTRECDTDLIRMYGSADQTFAPAAMFNRLPTFRKGLQMDKEEPIVGLRSEKDITDCITEAMKIPAHAMVGLTVKDVHESDENTTVEVEINVIADDDFNLSNPTLVFYTLEDNIEAERQAGAESGFKHNHVIRTDNGVFGENIEISNGKFNHTYTVTIENSWKKEDISFVAFVVNYDAENNNNNIVENVSSTPFIIDPSGISIISNEIPVETARYDLWGHRINDPVKGLNIIVYSDGFIKKVFN